MEGYRYPGVKPFSIEEKNLFFGRDQDIEKLHKLIKVEQLLLLYSKSGLGKSSLLNAGIISEFKKESSYEIINVRFGAYREENKITPVEILLDKIRQENIIPSFLDDIVRNDNQAQFWYQLKLLQLEKNKKNILIILDQFEELFTYKESEIYEFKIQLAEILNVVVPQKFQKIIEEKALSGLPSIPEDKLEQLYQPFNVKVVMAIRSDKMSLLNELKDHIPNILNKTYELTALDCDQAEDAILNPAYKKDHLFKSQPFDFTDEALDNILEYLTKGRKQKIESFQLQIICQYVENLVVDHKLSIIDTDALGEINDIFENYYDNLIQKLSTPEEQERARVFIEEKLIYEEDKTRLSIYEGQIYREYNISKDLLRQLVNSHLVRAEPNTAGGFSYELSHDTLVEPILKAKTKRLEKKRIQEQVEIAEAQRFAELEEQQRIAQRQKLKYTKRFLVAISIFAIVSIALAVSAITQTAKKENLVQELMSKHSELNEALSALKLSRASLQKSINKLQIKGDSLNLLLQLVKVEKEKADSAKIDAFHQRDEAKTANEKWVLADKREGLQNLLIDNEDGEWFLELDKKQRGYVLDKLLNVESDPAEFAHLKKSFLLAVKGNKAAIDDIMLALQYLNASRMINENDINNSILSELAGRILYDFRFENGVKNNEEDKDPKIINNLFYNKDKDQLAYTSNHGVFEFPLFDTVRGKQPEQKQIDGKASESYVRDAIFSNNGKYTLVKYKDKIRILDEQLSLITEDSTLIEEYATIAISNNGKYFASANYDYNTYPPAKLKIYERLKTKEGTDSISVSPIPSSSSIGFLKFTPDSKYLVYSNARGIVKIRDLKSSNEKEIRQRDLEAAGSITSIAISESSSLILVGDKKGNIVRADTTGKIKDSSKLYISISNIQYDPDNEHFLLTYSSLDVEKTMDTLTTDTSPTETAYSNKINYAKIGSIDSNRVKFYPGSLITPFFDAVTLLPNNKIATSKNATIFIWDFNGNKVKDISLRNLPPLPISKKIENALITVDEIIGSANKPDLFEALQYYGEKHEEGENYDKIERLCSALENKFRADLSKKELIYLNKIVANSYDYAVENEELDSLSIQEKIIKSISYRKQYQDTSNKQSVSAIIKKWESMASYFESGDRYNFALLYRQALNGLLGAYLSSDFSDKELIDNLVSSYLSAAEDHDKLKNDKEAVDAHLQRVKILEQAFKKFPTDEGIAKKLLMAYFLSGKEFTQNDKHILALEYQLKYVNTAEELRKIFAENQDIAREWIHSYYWAAEAYKGLKDYDYSLIYYQKYVKATEMAVESFPNEIDFAKELSDSYYTVGEFLTGLKNYDKAVIYYQKYAEKAERNYEEFPDDELIAGTWIDSYYYLSEAYQNIRNYDQSLKICLLRVEMADSMRHKFSYYSSIANSWASSLYKVGEICNKLKKYGMALEYQMKYAKAAETVYLDFSKNRTSVGNYLRSFYWIASAHDKQRNYDSALAYRKNGAAESEKIIKEFPNDSIIINEWIYLNNMLGRGYERLRDYQNAHSFRTKYIDTTEQWHQRYPDGVLILKRLLQAYTEMGSLQIKRKQYDSARFYFQKYIDTATYHFKKFEDSSTVLIDIANEYENLAEVSFELKDYTKNLDLLRKGNEIKENVFLHKYENDDFEVDMLKELSNSYAQLATANIYLKNRLEADRQIQKAVRLDSSSTFAQLSLAEWCLVNSKFEEAKRIYLLIRHEPFQEFSYGEYGLERLNKLERAGLINSPKQKVDAIKKLLKEDKN